MAGNSHHYRVTIDWTGNLGTGTSGYRAYGREHAIESPGKPPIQASADAAFRGDATRWNPEELLLAAAASCHQLAYLHLCAEAGVVVTAYSDAAEGTMQQDATGGGRFTAITLHPRVTIAPGSDAGTAMRLHEGAHHKCFIANSLNVDVAYEAEVDVG